MRIELVDPADAAALDRAHEIGRSAFAVDRPGVPLLDRDAFGALFSQGRPGSDVELLGAFDGDRMLGWTQVDYPTVENTNSAELFGMVDPRDRRRGAGRALLAAVVERARARGRDTLTAVVHEPLAGGGGTFAGTRFCEHAGADRALSERCFRLDLSTVDAGLPDRLLAEMRAYTEGYSLVQWCDGIAGKPPTEVLPGIAALLNRFFEDTPTGDLEVENLAYTPERVLADNEFGARQGRMTLNTAVRHDATGEVVGWTKVHTRPTAPTYGMQGITMVAEAHRGHRLGLVLKAANLRLIAERAPKLRHIDTDNAAANTHMIAVNDRLGYAPIQDSAFYRLRI